MGGDALQVVRTLIEQPTRGVMALHPNHDGDSIASNLALALVLRQRGHTIDIISREEPLTAFAFLPGWETIRYVGDAEIDLAAYDVFWALDMSAASRDGIGQVLPEAMHVLVIDHHHTNPGWGTINIIDAAASSTTAVLWQVFGDLAIDIDPELATMLLTGLATDTEFFSVGLAGEAFTAAAALMNAGADYSRIVFEVNRQVSTAAAHKIGAGLSSVSVLDDPPMAAIVLKGTANEVALAIGPLTNYSCSIADTDFGVVLVPLDSESLRIELRSRTIGFDVSGIARRLGGGGHQTRAGAQLFTGSIEDAMVAIREAAQAVRADE